MMELAQTDLQKAVGITVFWAGDSCRQRRGNVFEYMRVTFRKEV
jgi:hypothetical protein